ncbi:MAG: DMT family transporter [Beijerinckiaceae bacterium]
MSISMTSLLFAGVAVFAGIASACQTHMNGTLGRSIGDPVGAALWSFASGTILVLAIYIWRGGNLTMQSLVMTPGWAVLGGLMGALMVLGVTMTVPRIGVLTTVAAVVLGQAVMALALDAMCSPSAAHALSLQRIMALIMITSGLVLSRM